MRWMRLLLVAFVLGMLFAGQAWAIECAAVYGDGATEVRVATGSPGELGLVEALAKAFLDGKDARLCWVKAGSGKSLKLLKAKDVDAVMVHAPVAEKKAVAEGWADGRVLIGSNEFYLVGPPDDPAGVEGSTSVADAYARIAGSKKLFLSRGDNSGTHKKEMAIWGKAGVEPEGPWYVTTNDFMLATLKRADAEDGYFMTDSSTFLQAKPELERVVVLFSGDPFIINTYHALHQPAGATPAQPLAAEFVEFLGSGDGQEIIRAYGSEGGGDPLYNDAEYAKQFDH